MNRTLLSKDSEEWSERRTPAPSELPTRQSSFNPLAWRICETTEVAIPGNVTRSEIGKAVPKYFALFHFWIAVLTRLKGEVVVGYFHKNIEYSCPNNDENCWMFAVFNCDARSPE